MLWVRISAPLCLKSLHRRSHGHQIYLSSVHLCMMEHPSKENNLTSGLRNRELPGIHVGRCFLFEVHMCLWVVGGHIWVHSTYVQVCGDHRSILSIISKQPSILVFETVFHWNLDLSNLTRGLVSEAQGFACLCFGVFSPVPALPMLRLQICNTMPRFWAPNSQVRLLA